jgi:hypothetical protein
MEPNAIVAQKHCMTLFPVADRHFAIPALIERSSDRRNENMPNPFSQDRGFAPQAIQLVARLLPRRQAFACLRASHVNVT